MDRFVHQWRKEKARGEVYIIRFADDAILCFEYQSDSMALQAALEQNLQHYGLELNKAKTKLHRFGRNYPGRGAGKSESFDFLSLTHSVGKDRSGRYLVKRKTARKRLHRRPPANQAVVPETSSQATCVAMAGTEHEAQGPLCLFWCARKSPKSGTISLPGVEILAAVFEKTQSDQSHRQDKEVAE